jgi:hypothetical protein
MTIVILIAGIPVIAKSGYSYDYSNGNSYYTQEYSTKSTTVGISKNGKVWQNSIDNSGNQSGVDSNGNSWSYDKNSKLYMNYGTGEVKVNY